MRSRETPLLPSGFVVAERRLTLRAPVATSSAPHVVCAGSAAPLRSLASGPAVLEQSDGLRLVKSERYMARLTASRMA